ncbi:hypothetical protein CONCODRAFT_11886 [Conidiobolus coronatus NRRL 28638]|uniref:Uncharacterized protein n=1 Tax=Conidiobolus coronatus (strain ATCC 28846 / CBS 209.66 / NRRL 28638) TaxID=796925 RepID=A0A137NUB5_CONC2|nr:hypothetical protein CONCODRAFT_11886 [Conidiobolus coronatus NRRL 28638]|eukprot:KXN66312.1 hypothetical protein CONCODRAFT_11886 [Conidiobolus coronatus NRRL 28638]
MGISSCSLKFAIDTMFLRIEIPLSLPVLEVSLLFELPTFRKAQSNIPDTGCAIFILYFLWREVDL